MEKELQKPRYRPVLRAVAVAVCLAFALTQSNAALADPYLLRNGKCRTEEASKIKTPVPVPVRVAQAQNRTKTPVYRAPKFDEEKYTARMYRNIPKKAGIMGKVIVAAIVAAIAGLVAGLWPDKKEETPPPPTEPGTQPSTEPGTQPQTEPGTQPPTEPGTQPPTEPQPPVEPETQPQQIEDVYAQQDDGGQPTEAKASAYEFAGDQHNPAGSQTDTTEGIDGYYVYSQTRDGDADYQIDVDVTDGKEKGFLFFFDPRLDEFSGEESITFYVRGVEGASYPDAFYVTFYAFDYSGPVEAATFFISGVSDEFRKVSLPLDCLGNRDIWRIKVTFDPALTQNQKGSLIIDGLMELPTMNVAPDDGGPGTEIATASTGTFAVGEAACDVTLVKIFDSSRPDATVTAIEYDVTDSVTKGAFTVLADSAKDISGTDSLNLYARGDGTNYPSKFWIEVKDADGKVARRLIAGITNDYQKIPIRVSDLSSTIDVTNVKEVVLVIDPSILQAGEKQGMLYVDGIFEPDLAKAQVLPDDGQPGTEVATRSTGSFAVGQGACEPVLTQTFESPHSGLVVSAVDYDVSDDVTKGIFAVISDSAKDMSGLASLDLYIRGDAILGYPDAVFIELKDSNGNVARFVAEGITADYKKISIPLDVAKEDIDITDVKEVVLVIEPQFAGDKTGRLYIDGILEPDLLQVQVLPDDGQPGMAVSTVSTGTFAVGETTCEPILTQTFESPRSGATDTAIDYDVTDDVTKGIFAILADNAKDISGLDSLNLYARGGANYPSKFWIEVKDANGNAARCLVTGMSNNFRKVSIPVSVLALDIDVTNVKEVVILIDPCILQVGEKQGMLYVDGIFEPAQAQVSPDDGQAGTAPTSEATGAFIIGQADPAGVTLSYTASDAHYGPTDAVLRYDVTDGVAKGAYSVLADGHNDLSHLDAINIYARGDGESYPSNFCIEIKDANGKVARYLVTGITGEFQKVSIPASQLAGIIDLTRVKEMVVVVDPAILSDSQKQGTLVIDGIFDHF